ncbi:MAG: hypothetical protein A2219_05475 [Elusimicrobia bacterium RIFOXYA2_FULL_50_26]|nr:MAG: hypothetical protein A2219_05475 [Elusimicrobia bacterium RIFOXYA2_FULL_50_26]
MDKFTDAEKDELRAVAKSSEMRNDCAHLARNRHKFLKPDGSPDIDKIVTFIAHINTLLGHPTKPFKKISGNNFKL